MVLLCVVGFGTGGVLGALGANHWSTDIIDNVPANFQSFIDLLVQTRDALAATAVSEI